MTGLPLQGFRIVDCPTVLAGPLAATHLFDFAADVIKVELPGSAPEPVTPIPPRDERNKRSVAIDLRMPRGEEPVLKLVAKLPPRDVRALESFARLVLAADNTRWTCGPKSAFAERWSRASPQRASYRSRMESERMSRSRRRRGSHD